jgi:4-hydroxy-tetrahydrodipicolinate synthase
VTGQSTAFEPTRPAGVFAAAATPIHREGSVDLGSFDRLLDFLAERGMDGMVIGGGTGEYVHLTVEERACLTSRAVKRLGGRAVVMTSVGTSSVHSTIRLARMAADSGSRVLLLPMPYFFRYQQQDLAAFCEEVCRAANVPFLLYNLPGFTNPLDVDTCVDLLTRVPNLSGMKDSSGDPARLGPLAEARNGRNFSLLVGDDSLLLGALEAGWDGVVSGIACFAPELIAAIYRSYRSGATGKAAAYQEALDHLITYIVRLPIPWGVRAGLAARGIPTGPMHLPVTPERARQMVELQSWLAAWADERGFDLNEVWRLD